MVVVNLHLTNGYDQWRNKVFRNCRRGSSDIDTLRTVEETDTIVAVNFFLERGLTNNNNFSSLSPSLVCLSYTTYAYHPNTLTCRTSLSSRYLEADENNTQFRRPPNMRQPRIPYAVSEASQHASTKNPSGRIPRSVAPNTGVAVAASSPPAGPACRRQSLHTGLTTLPPSAFFKPFPCLNIRTRALVQNKTRS